MKVYFCKCKLGDNFGDYISPIIVKHVFGSAEVVDKEEKGKMLAVGSLLQRALRENDIVWGAGLIKDVKIIPPKGVKWLLTRGPLTRERMVGANIPEVYGDPALLLPDIYMPKVGKQWDVGVIPHYVDDRKEWDYFHKINILNNWKKIISEINACNMIMSSSLHGIVAAEAYGVPAVWIAPTDKIGGGEFKFQDYFLGTGRSKQIPSTFDNVRSLPKITNLDKIKKQIYESSHNGGGQRQ